MSRDGFRGVLQRKAPADSGNALGAAYRVGGGWWTGQGYAQHGDTIYLAVMDLVPLTTGHGQGEEHEKRRFASTTERYKPTTNY